MQGSVISGPDMSASDSETSILLTSSTEIHVPATERVDKISEDDIIVIETNQLKNETDARSWKQQKSSYCYFKTFIFKRIMMAMVED